MLVIMSDIHLTDGSTSINVNEEAFNILKEEIRINAKDNDAGEIRVVLLGDIFDFQRTDFWHSNEIPENERPWGGEIDLKTGMNKNKATIKKQFTEVLRGILNTPSGTAFIKTLNDIAIIAKKTGISTKISYVVGNHDRVLWNFHSLQSMIRDELNEVTENGEHTERVEFLRELYAPEYGVKARHGHEYDENTHGWEFYNEVLNPAQPIDRFDPKAYKVMAIGEVVTAELMGNVVFRVRQSIQNEDLIQKFKNVNNVRPLSDIIRWINWFQSDVDVSETEKEIILQCFKDSLEAVINTEYSKKWDEITTNIVIRGDLIDRLELIYKIIKNASYRDFERYVRKYEFFDNLFGETKNKHLEAAEQEWSLINSKNQSDIQYIVYGHTHVPIRQYFNGYTNDKVRMYINTGTYLPLIQRASEKGFAMSYQMTMLFFYKADEDNGNKLHGPSMDLWNGIKRKTYKFQND